MSSPIAVSKPNLVTELHKELSFEAAHRLPHVPPGHKCARLHSHSFRVVITMRGPVHPERGWIVDYADIAAAWRPLFEVLDHNYLNDVEGLANPTSEHLAAWIYERFHLADAHVHSVKVCETCTSSCTVYAAA